MHIQLMEFILENLWQYLLVEVSCYFVNIHKKIKNEEKAQLKQPAMDMHLLYFFKTSLDSLYFLLLPLQLDSNRIGCQLWHSLKVYTCLSYSCQGFSLFFEMLVTLHIEIKFLQYKIILVAKKGYFFMVVL